MLNKRQFLFMQGLKIVQWVTQFDPHNVNTLDLELPADLIAYYEYASQELRAI